jgi:hypothetical protein
LREFDKILKEISKAVDDFTKDLPGVEKEVLNKILRTLKDLELQGDNVKVSVKNIRLVADIKNQIQGIILSDKYIDTLRDFVKSFDTITDLQNKYWKSVEETFKPNAVLNEIKTQSINDTVDKLTEAGIGANIGDKITDILRQNINAGGSYSSLTDQLKELIVQTDTDGVLTKYAKQITVDSVNQYNAQYTKTVSDDLGFEWYIYDNTDIDTTRPWCDAMTDKKYIHVSEISDLIRGKGLTYVNKEGDRVPVPIYDKTGLPHGMIPGTDAANIFVRRGGYNCQHQWRPISERLVPVDVRARINPVQTSTSEETTPAKTS